MRYWTFVSSGRLHALMLLLAAACFAQTAQAQSYRVLEQLGDGTVITRPAEVQDNLDGMDPTTHHMLFGASTRRGTAQIFWLSFEDPITWDHGEPTNSDYEMILTARLPRGGDILYQAWSYDNDELIEGFAHVRSSGRDGWGIDQAKIQALPEGSYELQAIVRIPGRNHARAIQRIEVRGDRQLDFVRKPDLIIRPNAGDNDPDANPEDGDQDTIRDSFNRGDKPSRGTPGDTTAPADHDWPLGDAGFTALPLKDGGRVIHVSTSGSDRNNGLTPETAVRTPQRGYRLLRNGRPDQLRFKAGDVFTQRIAGWGLSGRSADAPMVIGVYGEGARPKFEIQGALFYVEARHTVRYLAVQGLHLHCTNRDPRHADYESNAYPAQGIFWVGGGSDLLIEDCIIEFFAYGMTINSPSHDDLIERVTIRRNIIRYCWNTGHGNRAGMITGFVKDLVIEENLYDHNGWLPPAWGVNDADPDDQSHALYLAPLPEEEGPDVPATIRGNIFARSGSHGIKGGPGGVLEDNLFVGNAIAGYMSRSDSVIRGNMVLEGRDISSSSIRGWGLEAFGMQNLTVEDNVFAHRRSEGEHGHALKMFASNITYRGNIYYDWARTDQPNLDYIGGNNAMNASGNLGNAFTMTDGGSFVDPDRSVGSYHGSLGKEATLEAFLATAGARPRSTWDPAYAQAGVDAYIREGLRVLGPTRQ